LRGWLAHHACRAPVQPRPGRRRRDERARAATPRGSRCSTPSSGAGDDPHWWQDPRNVVRATERVRAAFARADPDGASAYARAAAAYTRRVRALDTVALDAGARVGPALYADTLGPEGSEGATYLGALRHDAAAIAAGFGGDCDLPRP
jgi:ABC-type Zn uptake system ZnuABC Zn-binding protein ZnuA